MANEKVKEYKAWFTSDLPLKEIGEQLTKAEVISRSTYDYENVYEWVEGETNNKDLEFNISRKHCDGQGFEEERISVLAMYTSQEPDNQVIENIAKIISKEFKCRVFLGSINYIQDDEFEYKAINEIYLWVE